MPRLTASAREAAAASTRISIPLLLLPPPNWSEMESQYLFRRMNLVIAQLVLQKSLVVICPIVHLTIADPYMVLILSCKMALALERFDFEVPVEIPSDSLISWWLYPSMAYRLNTMR
jgi:hypothetical protein